MALSDDLEALIARRPGLTEAQLADDLFGANGYQQRVNSTCRRMLKQGRVRREGRGYRAETHRYYVT
jgi:hypothetical protein